jgi:Arc/MetJ-type ribon-helix-helix transcriptional regulator
MAVGVRARRVKISATVEAGLLEQVDRYVAERPGTSRSAVIEEALRLWTARERERAMEAQYADPLPLSDDDAAEWEAWRRIRQASAARLFRDR